jgi:sec-independent protein translocase protein TatB
MFDLGWSELLVIGIVALIVVGPKDLPGMFRTLGRFTGKLRRMAREFQRAMDDAADQTGVKEAASDLRNMSNPTKMGMDKIKDAAKSFEDYDPTKPSDKVKSAGPETAKMSEERAEAARKIREYSTKKGQERLDREKAEAEAESAAEKAAEAPSASDDGGETKA